MANELPKSNPASCVRAVSMVVTSEEFSQELLYSIAGGTAIHQAMKLSLQYRDSCTQHAEQSSVCGG